MHKIDEILNLLELCVRGRCSDIEERKIHDFSSELLEQSSCGKNELFEGINQENIISLAVQLHNKAKHIVLNNFGAETKAMIRSAAAWIIGTYGDKTPKVLCTCIKLHSRVAKELTMIEGINSSMICKSLNEAITMWESIDQNSIEKVWVVQIILK